MAFDQNTRNRLARFVSDARALLTEEFTRQLQNEYGLDPTSGTVTGLDRLTALDDSRRETARILRETMDYYLASSSQNGKNGVRQTLERIMREQAFTVLNRMCALRMAEGRDFLVESVKSGYQSKGFQLYTRLTGPAVGETGEAYSSYLFSIFDELALDLPALFDRFSPQGRLFPREGALLRLLEMINDPEIEALWAEDETIGWIYQYFNSQEERRQMRAESSAPRNSRELAVRNQFFTPRYVVEFLSDNTLGRIWYEMTQGQTGLMESCRYLVRRPEEVFLAEAATAGAEHADEWSLEAARWLQEGSEESFSPFDESYRSRQRLIQLASVVDGYQRYPQPGEWERWELVRMHRAIQQQEDLSSSSLQELLDVMFFMYRSDHWADGEFLDNPRELRLLARIGNEVRQRVLVGRGEDPSQEELLRSPVFIPYRPLKDPREINMLDPACGSMHFGLYAFDLFEQIYLEAWDLEERLGQNVLWRLDGLESLHNTYYDKKSFLQDVPRLIIERNIHGIDIDPRAVQIAGMSLWLRVQRSWQAQGLKPGERPQIRKSNIVCAEPMPGDRRMLEEFLDAFKEDRLEALMRKVLPAGQTVRATKAMADALAKLVRTVWQEMELAGEAGSILKIEDTLREAVAKARKESEEKAPLFRVLEFGLDEPVQDRSIQVIPSKEQEFWSWADTLVLGALQEFTEKAEGEDSYRRRLFYGEMAHGFSFIHLCRNRYDIVVMNPPYGASTSRVSDYLKVHFNEGKTDLYASFIIRAEELLINNGYCGSLTDRSFLMLPTFTKLRESVFLKKFPLSILADLWYNVLDSAMNRTAAYILEKTEYCSNPSIFINLRFEEDKGEALKKSIQKIDHGINDDNITSYNLELFKIVPETRIAHWAGMDLIKVFKHPKIEPSLGFVRAGIQTCDDFQFIRYWYEVPNHGISPKIQGEWAFLMKGGEYYPYGNCTNLIIRYGDHDKIASFIKYFIGRQPSRHLQNITSYGVGGYTCALVSEVFYSQFMPMGSIFSIAGQGIILPKELIFSGLALLNSSLSHYYLSMLTGGHRWDGKSIASLPFGDFIFHYKLNELGKSLFRLQYLIDIRDETSIRFFAPDINGVLDTDLLTSEAISIQDQIDLTVFDIYKINNSGREEITEYCYHNKIRPFRLRNNFVDIEETSRYFSFISYAIGCVFSRWDIRHAINDHVPTSLTDPYSPLPACSPGMLQNSRGLPADPIDVPEYYPLRITWGGVLVNDENHPEDIVKRTREVLQLIWDEHAEVIEQEACQLLDVHSLREYFQKSNQFFSDHLKRYSKSRRSAPIYWPLSTPSNSYTLWLYFNRLSDQTLFSCVNDFVDPKLKQVSNDAAHLRHKRQRSAIEEKELERLIDFELELKDFREELLRVASFWKPNLNDGVQITAAPLWRLFQYKPWQKKLKETWEKLERGDYDWAHLAYSIWPERVRKKCKSDKSLAIAHDLEHLYQKPKTPKKGKRGRQKVELEMDEVSGED